VPGPLRPLTPETTLGFDLAEFSRLIGEPLLPHQEEAALRGLELHPDTGKLRFRYVLNLCARQNGKTALGRQLVLWRMYRASRGQAVLGVAQDLAQAAYAWELTLRAAEARPYLASDIVTKSRASGQYRFVLRNGSEYTIRSANASAGRGLSCCCVLFDELRTQVDEAGFASVSPTITASPNGQIVAMSNAGDESSTVLNSLYASGIAGGADSQILVMSWSAPDGCERDDIEAWRYANPGLGHIIDLATLRAQYQALSPARFRAEHLNQQVVALNSAVNLEAWKACADPLQRLEAHRQRAAACFDTFGDTASLAVAARLADGTIAVELAEAWDTVTEARAALPALLDRIRPRRLGWYPSAAAAFAPILRIRPGSTEITGTAIAEACMGFCDQVAARQLVHGDQARLNRHVASAERLAAGDGYKFGRKGAHGDITGAYAAAGAVHLIASGPGPHRARVRFLDF
jgi:phage terminase large subunit-like protein